MGLDRGQGRGGGGGCTGRTTESAYKKLRAFSLAPSSATSILDAALLSATNRLRRHDYRYERTTLHYLPSPPSLRLSAPLALLPFPPSQPPSLPLSFLPSLPPAFPSVPIPPSLHPFLRPPPPSAITMAHAPFLLPPPPAPVSRLISHFSSHREKSMPS